jgi:RNA 2',3'-cyclic 3'-phosphodiesterase
MRVFFGVELPEDVKAAAGAVAGQLQQRVHTKARGASIRWVDPANLHITLWFIGEIDDAALAALTTATNIPFATPRFLLQFGGVGTFPSSSSPRVLWIGLRSGVEPLQSIYAELARRLAPWGYEPERRPYSPHLTIARIKEIRRGDVKAFRTAVDLSIEPFGCEVAAVTMFRSRLSPKGARYEPLLRVPLT